MHTTTRPEIYQIELHRLADSPFQPRHTYRGLAELAASIRVDGVLEPILARPIIEQAIGADPAQDIEVVAGHRRLRAARLAELAEIPTIIRPMTDLEVKRVQLVENIQRDDMSAIEEARALRALVDEGEKIRDIARDIGKSERHVYAKLGLLRLTCRALEAVDLGTIPAEIGVLISSYAPTLQDRALDICAPDGAALSLRKARQALADDGLVKPLAKAPFPLALVLDSATGCSVCTRNSTNLRQDERDQLGDEMCIHPPCYLAKTRASNDQRLEKRQAQGWLIGDGKAPAPLYQEAAYWEKEIEEARRIDPMRAAACCCAWIAVDKLHEWVTYDGIHTLKSLCGLAVAPVRTPSPASQEAASCGDGETSAPSVATPRDRSAEAPSAVKPNTAETSYYDALTDRIVSGILTCDGDRRTEDELLYVTAALVLTSVDTVQYLAKKGALPKWGTTWHELDGHLDAMRGMSAGELGRLALAAAIYQIQMWTSTAWTTHSPAAENILRGLAARYAVEATTDSSRGTAAEDDDQSGLSAGEDEEDQGPLAGAEKVFVDAGLAACPPTNRAPYRCPSTGATWSGRGLKPLWLRQELAAGRSLTEFANPNATSSDAEAA